MLPWLLAAKPFKSAATQRQTMAAQQLVSRGGRDRPAYVSFKLNFQLGNGKGARFLVLGNEMRQEFCLFLKAHRGMISQLFFRPDLYPARLNALKLRPELPSAALG